MSTSYTLEKRICKYGDNCSLLYNVNTYSAIARHRLNKILHHVEKYVHYQYGYNRRIARIITIAVMLFHIPIVTTYIGMELLSHRCKIIRLKSCTAKICNIYQQNQSCLLYILSQYSRADNPSTKFQMHKVGHETNLLAVVHLLTSIYKPTQQE